MHDLKTLMDSYLEAERAIEWARQKQKAIKKAMSERIGVEVVGAYPSCNFITIAKPIDGMAAQLVPAGSINDKPFRSMETKIDGIDINHFAEVEP
jgi:hypothetical protein